jgi:hypothetical protein
MNNYDEMLDSNKNTDGKLAQFGAQAVPPTATSEEELFCGI